MQSPGYDIKELVQEAHYRWLKPAEVLFILQNHGDHQLTETPLQKPPSGSLFLFNKRVLRFFRKDGHSWRKKKDGRTVGEAHERLKVGNVEALNCYYAHGEVTPNFQRRSYWMLDPAYEHIVLVHYREINEGRLRSANSQGSPGLSYTSCQSPSFSSAYHPAAGSEQHDPYVSSFSPESVEVSSEIVSRNNVMGQMNGKSRVGDLSRSPKVEVGQALRRLEEQLSLNDDDIAELFPQYEQSNNLGFLNPEKMSHQDELPVLKSIESSELQQVGQQEDSKINLFLQVSGEYTTEKKDTPFWKETLELCSDYTWMNLEEKGLNTSERSENTFASESGKLSAYLTEQPEDRTPQWLDLRRNDTENKNEYYSTSENSFSQQLSEAKHFLLGSDDAIVSSTLSSLPQQYESYETNASPFTLSSCGENSDHYKNLFEQESQPTSSHRSDANLPLAQTQKFSIQEISPERGYTTENTKVIITGYFLCDPSTCAWACMFGNIEVPVQIIQEGVLRCHAPPNIPGKVNLCITSGNRVSCSEVREFEYFVKPSNCSYSSEEEPTKSTEELLLLVRFAHMLLSDSLVQKNKVELGICKEDPWELVIEDLLVGTATPSGTMDWILQELLKDKLQQWLSSKYQEGNTSSCSLSRKEQGIIHMAAGLGFEWALIPILNSGVSINFRDINGWTALHWAARFGREKMVASLVASGASALAVTDPTSQDPSGKTPGFIAAASGHKGLAGYLSELALTSHLSSLRLEESEICKGSAVVEAERTVESISIGSLGSTEDQLSLKDSLAAVRNAAQAAARIQSAFRAHSFRRRQQIEFDTGVYDENGITQDDIYGLSNASKLAFRNLRDHSVDKAALSIQKKYRGYKGRKDFLAIRQKVVRIQTWS
ncbi:Calmodulin-binding transcription activator [Thalictrum thalictroides]|uniref:Calmodulin-binding transcription activator n=1 Tax=Thalictrum thalictroides TaxID=46969 RepID=A0A7J6X0K4_THATH|nr:Calmodulin-binding transcription activator [Thalictrum thalictroides]